MRPGDTPLIRRSDLLEAIKRHFMQELTVDFNEEIAKFLSFKREETRGDFSYPPTRRQPNRSRGARNAATRPGQGTNQSTHGNPLGVDSSSGTSGTAQQHSLADISGTKARANTANNSTI